MFRADSLPFTSQIVEHSRYLPLRKKPVIVCPSHLPPIRPLRQPFIGETDPLKRVNDRLGFSWELRSEIARKSMISVIYLGVTDVFCLSCHLSVFFIKKCPGEKLPVGRLLLQRVLSFCGKPKLTISMDKVIETESTI